MDRHYDSSEGEFVDFETLADWEERDKAKNARIEALEARLAKADALARAFEEFNDKIDKARAPVFSARLAAIKALTAYREGSE